MKATCIFKANEKKVPRKIIIIIIQTFCVEENGEELAGNMKNENASTEA